MLYILRSENKISGNSNDFTIQINNNHLINKDKKHKVFMKTIIPIGIENNKYIEVEIKGLGSSFIYDTSTGNFESNVAKYYFHTASEKTIYYPKIELESLDLSMIDIKVFNLTDNTLAALDEIIFVFELQEDYTS